MNHQPALAVLLAMTAVAVTNTSAYPLDAYERTGIGRLEAQRRVEADEMPGSKQPAGALLGSEAVDIRLLEHPDMALPGVDGGFTAQIRELLGEHAGDYSIAVLDLSDIANPRYAEHNGDVRRNPGSVGKLLVALGVFQAIADRFPTDIAAREQLLRQTEIVADDFIVSDHHTVRRWDEATETLIRRPLQQGDTGSLWEYLDWMVSPSSNAAAAMLAREAVLMRALGPAYPPAPEAASAFFEQTPRGELAGLLERAIQQPVTDNGLDLSRIRQGSLFTRTGKQKVPGTSSYATVRSLMRLLLRMEQGRLVDTFSSREMKRLMYVTERRIRYASSPALRDAAVYFKSGSLYQCEPEPEFTCRKYHGNKLNLMNSVAIVEAPAAGRGLHYLVALTSNVLRRNAAVDHQTLATRIHRLIERYHADALRAERAAAVARSIEAADDDAAVAPGAGEAGPQAVPADIRETTEDR